MRFSAVALAFTCVCAFAQSPADVFDKAPPQIDKALRERVDLFFAAHASGRFRTAEQVVHDDSKDIFYDSAKTKILGWETVKINYSDNFTKAVVITNLDMEWVTARLGKIRVKPPMKTLWKQDGGLWWWYAEPKNEWETPFGLMKPGADPVKGNSPAPQWTVRDKSDVLNQVRISRQEIRLSSYQESEDSAEITNGMPGELNLQLDKSSVPPGLEVTLSKSKLSSGEKATLAFRYQPPDKSVKTTRQIELTAVEMGQRYVFTVTFAVPPELEKYIPKTKQN